MPRTSAGILLYRLCSGQLEVLLVHPGGPFWTHKDVNAWSIPKGEFVPPETAFEAAQREFHEEIGHLVTGTFQELQPVRQSGGKIVYAWAVEGDCDVTKVRSNMCRLEWPRGSGHWRTFPEVDRAAWFSADEARIKLVKGQVPLLDQLLALLGEPSAEASG